MTVVHLVPAMEQGGVESVVVNLNRVVVRAGWNSVVVSKGGRLAGKIVADGGRHVEVDLKSKNPLTYFRRAKKLRKVLANLAKDDSRLLVCAHSRVPAWLFVWANRSLDLKWITYAHGANSVSRYSAVMTRGDLVVAPSRFLAGFLLEKYGEKGRRKKEEGKSVEDKIRGLAKRLRVISPCVDLERFDPENLDKAFIEAKRREWGIEPGTFVTMSVGRITPLKGFSNVLRDFAAAGRPGAKLVIVGGVDKRHEGHLAELKSLAGSLGVADRVVFAGSQSKVPECLSMADEIVVGNMEKPESFGLSVVEALAMEKPVRLMREFGGAAEILAAMGRQGCQTSDVREAVRSLYGFDVFAEKTLMTYEELINQPLTTSH